MTSASHKKHLKNKRREEKIRKEKLAGKNELVKTLTSSDRMMGRNRLLIVLGVIGVFSAIAFYNFR